MATTHSAVYGFNQQRDAHSSDLATSDLLNRKITFASEWIFKPAGVAEVKIRFEKALANTGYVARHEWSSEERVFRLHCNPGEDNLVGNLFHSVMGSVIKGAVKAAKKAAYFKDRYEFDENDDDDDDSDDEFDMDEPSHWESTKIERILLGRAEPPTLEENSDNDTIPEITSGYPDEIQFSVFKSIWINKDTTKELNAFISDQALAELNRLTGCVFVKAVRRRCIFIGGHEASCRIAFHKLNNIEKYSKLSGMFIDHLFYTEGSENVRFVLKKITEVKARYYETTLLDNLHLDVNSGYHNLSEAVTIRCALYNQANATYIPLKKLGISPITSSSWSPAPAYGPWIDFKYSAKVSQSPMYDFDRRTQPVATLPGPEIMAAIAPEDATKSTECERWAKGLPDALPLVGVQDNQTIGASNASQNTAIKATTPKTSWDTFTEYNVDGHLGTRVPMTTMLSQNLDKNITAIALSAQQVASPPSSLPAMPPMLNLLEEDDFVLVSETLGGEFIALQPAGVFESLKPADDEGSTRELRTGRLKTPQSSLPNRAIYKEAIEAIYPDPLPGFIAGLNSGFHRMMNVATGFRGELIVRVEFGRCLLRNLRNDGRLFTESSLRETLLVSQVPWVTNVISMESEEMSFILAMKGRDGNALWKTKLATWNVTYVFHCWEEATSTLFIIEIDAETFVTQIKIKHTLGSLYIHGTKRHWDCCITATGFEQNRVLEERYGRLAAAIYESLYIKGGCTEPSLLWELNTSLSNDFNIDDVRVRRICSYNGTDETSILYITQFQALYIQDKAIRGSKDLKAYRAIAVPSNELPCNELSSWFEIAIANAQQTFEENKTLELGDSTKWTADTLAEMKMAESLFLPACDMLKQMDGVGQYNDHGIERPVRGTTTQQDAPPMSPNISNEQHAPPTSSVVSNEEQFW